MSPVQPRRRRCPWATSDLLVAYHDAEWGVPVRDDRRHYELLTLEGAQAGLAWETILAKRQGYRAAFAGFDPERVAAFGPDAIDRLVANPAIVRHRGKIEAAIVNARALLDLRGREGSFDGWVWGFVDGRPIVNRWRRIEEVPAHSEISRALSRELKRRGFRFVGPTTAYAYLQAAGLVNDHLVGCFRHAECARLAGG